MAALRAGSRYRIVLSMSEWLNHQSTARKSAIFIFSI
jgi:hypothetical protein